MVVNRSIKIHRPAARLYAYWHNLKNLAQLVPGGATVTARSDRISHWCVQIPPGQTVEWDAELTEDIPARAISWRSVAGSMVRNSGTVRFEPVDDEPNATLVSVTADYTPPGGMLGRVVAKLGANRADREIDAALRRVKTELEES